MDDYDFEKLVNGQVSFDNLTGRLQKWSESFADTMVDTAEVKITYDGVKATADSVLNNLSNEEIVSGIEELQGSLKSVPEVVDNGRDIALSVGSGTFMAVMEWGVSEINGIIRRVEQTVEQEVRDRALNTSDFDDAVKNTLALTMDNLIGMVEKGQVSFESEIDELVDDIGLKLSTEAENGANEEAIKVADYLLNDPGYSIPEFFNGLSDAELDKTETERYYWGLYEDKHQDLLTAFADEFGNNGLASYYDLEEFADSSLGRYYRDEVGRIFDNAYETFKGKIRERIGDYLEQNFR